MQKPKLNLSPVSNALGVEIMDISIEDALKPHIFEQIYAAFLKHHLILFNNIDLSPALQVEFAKKFGDVQVHVMNQYHGYGHPEIYLLTNLGEDGKPNGKHPDKGTMYWHTDGSWRKKTGHATMMYSEIVPAHGGQTHFCNMNKVFENLTENTRKRLEGLKAIHNLDFSRTRRHGEDPMTTEQRAEVPPVAHPIIRLHPETNLKSIFLGDHAETIEGWNYDVGRNFIEEISAEITPKELIYKHQWQPKQIAIWDNRCLLHRATPYDTKKEKRVMRRCTINGDQPYG